MTLSVILGVTLFIAFANGANDNFKGVATLFGSGTTKYKGALLWATLTTFLGSLTAFFFSSKLIKTFSGKGLVPSELVLDPNFLIAVILGAGLTVFFTARFGIPISTTHSLTGALVGAGFAAIGFDLAFGVLGKNFFYPLFLSPFLAVGITAIIYTFVKWVKKMGGFQKKTCLCLGERIVPVPGLQFTHGEVVSTVTLRKYDVFIDEKEACEAKAIEIYDGEVFGISQQAIINSLHYLSAGAVSFARGLNDTPKIVALSVAVGALSLQWNIVMVAVAMMLGGFIMARRIAETMALKITPMTHGQGLSGNIVTAFLVIIASSMGVPVSTTHVSCGVLFGIGLASGKGHWKIISGIIGAWILTLPIAAGFGALIFLILDKGLFLG